MLKKILNPFILLSLFFILSACGGGGGGSGAAGGGVGTSTITACSDTGTAYQTSEYYYGGVSTSDSPQKVCASSAYARGATGDGIQVAVVDTGVYASPFVIDANMVTAVTGSDTVNSDKILMMMRVMDRMLQES